MAREYARGDLQSDVRYIRANRPRLLENAGISDRDAKEGPVRYELQSIAAITAEDRKVIYQYLSSIEKIDYLEKAVAEIPEAGIREIARDTLLRGIRVEELAEECDLSERTVRWKKHKALEYMAEMYLAAGFYTG